MTVLLAVLDVIYWVTVAAAAVALIAFIVALVDAVAGSIRDGEWL